MKSITGHIGTVEHIERVDTSYNGNPRYSFYVDGYRIYTGVDSSHGYSITNFEGKKVEVNIGSHYGKLTLHTIRAI